MCDKKKSRKTKGNSQMEYMKLMKLNKTGYADK